jgi:hypothetical protein
MGSASANFAGSVESIHIVQQNELNEYFRLTYFLPADPIYYRPKKLGKVQVPRNCKKAKDCHFLRYYFF